MSPVKSGDTTGIDPPVASLRTQVYNPAAVGTPHCVIFNSGASPAYIGGSAVTPATGLLFPPGAQLSLPYASYAIWACDGGITTGTPVSSLSSAAASGAGTVVIAAGTAGFGAGATIQVGVGNGSETVSIVSNTGGTAIISPNFVFDHNSAATVVTIATQAATSLSVNAGTT
jgi:hypothetical protein